MVTSHQEVNWEWQASDEEFGFEIPLGNRILMSLMPSTITQGWYAYWHSNTQRNGLPNLHGKMLEEVGLEVAKIQLGDHFSSIGQFDHCLHN